MKQLFEALRLKLQPTLRKNAVRAAALCAGMAVCTAALADQPELDYRSADGLPVLGTLVPEASARYSRLPDSLQGQVRDELWNLGLNSAGLSVRFRTDSRCLGVKWHSRNKFRMNHMTDTGVRGLDLYALTDTGWTFVNSARPGFASHNNSSRLASNLPEGTREYMLFLSLYDGTDSLYIGVDSAAMLAAPALEVPVRTAPVVMYGTSILQGGCATRPGMAHTNILQRKLNREVVNLGFSGNARLDPEIARLMASAHNPALFVVDALPNCSADLVDEKMENFIAILRAAHPEVPILLVESPWFPIMRWDAEVEQTLRDKNSRLRAIYERLAASDTNLHYFEADGVFAGDTENTVDNYHLTDGGFRAFADRLSPVILNIIANQ